jgi:hypothetical protein
MHQEIYGPKQSARIIVKQGRKKCKGDFVTYPSDKLRDIQPDGLRHFDLRSYIIFRVRPSVHFTLMVKVFRRESKGTNRRWIPTFVGMGDGWAVRFVHQSKTEYLECDLTAEMTKGERGKIPLYLSHRASGT